LFYRVQRGQTLQKGRHIARIARVDQSDLYCLWGIRYTRKRIVHVQMWTCSHACGITLCIEGRYQLHKKVVNKKKKQHIHIGGCSGSNWTVFAGTTGSLLCRTNSRPTLLWGQAGELVAYTNVSVSKKSW
jgi:hypothetical protein